MAGRTIRISLWPGLVLLCMIVHTTQDTRQKRQISTQQPKIITTDGHLVFQTGTNHNITFRSTAGGYINVNGEDLMSLAQTVKNNKRAIDEVRASPTEIPSTIDRRLSSLEQRLDNLQPTGNVLSQLTGLENRLSAIEDSNIASRLSASETGFQNLQTSLSSFTSHFVTVRRNVDVIQSQLTDVTSTVQRVTDLESGVRVLKRKVRTLKNLLTQNECSSNPCRHGGTCLDRYNGFNCRCPPQWKGLLCEEDVNECTEYAGTDLGCQNGGTCVNSHGGFTCQCTSNWHGTHCREQHNDCTGASSRELCGHGTCVNLQRVQPGQPRYHCICEGGWTKSGTDPACTTDVDECSGNRPACSVDPQVSCVNVPGTFYCGQCPAGYSGNGFSCADINECAVNNGGCSLSPRTDCVNTRGSRTCGPCSSGYQGDGVTCSWVGVCHTNNGGCHPHASCTQIPGVRICTCQPGYVGNGIGYTGCVQQGPVSGPCTSNPCRNGAACQVNGNMFLCVCLPGYQGQQCETNIHECASNPCQNGGTCTDQVNGYQCQCVAAYSGNNCQDEQQTCGGSLTGETGTITYPTTPGSTYPHGLSCAYRITTTPGMIVMLTFTSFSVENHATCGYDFVQINDGPTAAAYTLGKFCGSSLPNDGNPINSTQHQMYLWFFTDISVTDTGFTATWTSALPVCGGRLSGQNHGAINSPGYPGNYPHDRTCSWEITVQPGNNIMFTFAHLALEAHPNCSFDYVEIRDGPWPTSQVLQRFCNTSQPPPLSTTGPSAFVKFQSDGTLSDRGFHITYVGISAGDYCGGQFTSETGVITSPNYPSTYDHSGSCVWTITVSQSDAITLTFTAMDVEGGSCHYDYIEVRDGSDENAQLFGRYCGTTRPSNLVSSGNTMYIAFHTDSSVAGNGFRVEWTTACGGLYTSLQGTIQSPNYPNAYPGSKECIYLFNQPTGNAVTLTFTFFDVEGVSGGSCIFDYVEIRDGGTADAPLLGRHCGTQIPEPVAATQNQMWVKFVTDSSVHNLGFSADYVSQPVPCGTVLTDSTGTIQSPGHPNIYPHGANCTWRVTVAPGLVIRLSFQSLSLEGNWGSTCYFDYVDVYDNSSAVLASRIGRYCGNGMPPTITSTDNVITVVFRTDGSIAHEGFTASYVTLNASTVCGRTLLTSVGVITSPNFPNNYPHNRECVWNIVAPQRMQILLNITDFQLERHRNCVFDYLEIRNGGFEDSPLVNRYCGRTIDQTIQSHSNRLWLKFKSDFSMSAPGFRIYYDATATGCGADLVGPRGSFISPNYPSTYPHNAECFWTIRVSRGSKILFNITDLDTESSTACRLDYIEVRERSSSGSLRGRFCGSQIPGPILSNTSAIWVKYKTDYSVAGRGFHATYVSVCNVRLTDHSGVIESPNFPEPYPHNRNCTWVIEATTGNTINASFSHFSMESHRSCNFDYLQIRDGGLPTSDSLGRFCGTSLPPPVFSTGNKLSVHFVSDFSVASNGFRLEYITNGCGGYLRMPSGNLASPDYPNNYPHRCVCEWYISTATGTRIQLTLHDIDFEAHVNCTYDSLTIFGGMDSGSPQLAKLCHTQTGQQVLTSTGNYMFIRFKSDVSINGRGFQATYTSLAGGCGGNYSIPSGAIASANYPNNYPHNTECVWLITVATTQNVELTFDDFYVEGSSTCYFDYVKVYDGPTLNDPLLLTYCGNTIPSPPAYRSSSNKMLVRMRTDYSVSYRGFHATYVTGCGGTLSAEQDGVISSPNYPAFYTPSNNCSWLILGEHADDRITITFTHMDTEFYSSCVHDYVAVYNGNDDDAPLIGQYCGTVIPTPLTSLGSAMFVTFISDPSVQKSGFRAVYTKSSSACGGDFTAERGSIMSPGYPNLYPPSIECVWTFSMSPGSRIMVSFSVFSIEEHDSCNLDYVELREGDVNGNLMGRFCGNTAPSNLTALNGLWMKFRSDDTPGTGVGFIGQYSPAYGGDLTGSSGRVASPLYPSQYPHNADYVWTITVDTNLRIRVTFSAMDMEFVQSGCIYDYLKFLDGGLETSPEIGRYCGITVPDSLLSTTNQLRVVFHTDFSASGQGFLFDWQATSEMVTTPAPGSSVTPAPGCGGRLNPAPYQMMTIISPGYPDGYADNLECVWELSTLPGFVIWFNITDINLERHSSCNYDTLTVYDGTYSSRGRGPQLGSFCGRVGNSQPLLSTFTQMTLRFKTDYSINRTGFSVNAQAVCGGIMRMSSGVLRSPNYPNPYANNINCTWYVRVLVGRTIQVQFNNTFNIARSGGSCQGDYIRLLNGPTTGSPPVGNSLTGTYCGNSLPARMNTSSNYLTVNFVSDGSGTASGFELLFSDISVTCGGSLQLTGQVDSGYFMSPNYPEVYPHNVDCTWVIIAPGVHRIRLDFVESFSIEGHSSNNPCLYDYVELRDGGTINSRVLAHVCGSTRPSTYRSLGNVMFVRFRTDTSVARQGFKARYSIASCGGRIAGTSGVVSSPNYPNTYPSNSECVWDIEAPTGHYITFTFGTRVSLQYSSNCSGIDQDFLEIREINSTGPVILRTCGRRTPSSVDTSDSFALVTFKSDATYNYAGFSMNFQASVEVCGGDLTSPTGTFTSPNFPGQYAHSRVCVWLITVAQGRRVTLTFTSFNLESASRCHFDYVAVYDGILTDSPSFARLCGETTPAVQQSSANTMKVVFRTDGSISNGGFQASYTSNNEQVCGGMLTTSRSNFTSPGYWAGTNYTNHQQCVWIISNRNVSNTSIVVSFDSFHLEGSFSGSCGYDFLEFREGDSPSGTLLGKFCGTTASSVYTPMPYMWVRFKTDQSIVDRGFSLSYKFTDCGGILTQSTGVITSPNFPNLYNHSDSCVWLIQAPQATRIRVSFSDFEIESHPACVFDYVELLNGPYADSPSIGKFCGSTSPDQFTSQYNAIRVTFRTDSSVHRQGFRLNYNFQTGGCGGLYHSNDGQIMSPNHPHSYPHSTECIWDINVDPGYHVALSFNPPFDMENHTQCAFDYVEVSNGLWNGSVVPRGRWCSNITPPPQNSTANRLVVKFRSDVNTNGNGFSANWTVGCGSIFTEPSGRIVSPGYPNRYQNNMLCNYTISVDPQRFIVLDFLNFDLEGGVNCPHDYVQAFPSINSSMFTWRRLGRFCGTTVPQSISSLGTMFIQFRTDHSVVRNGFNIQYRTSECGGNYTAPYGVIRTPQQPARYHHHANCTWLITVATNRVIYFKFNDFDIESHSRCNYDYVDLYDGGSLSSPLMGHFCGNIVPDIQRTTSNVLLVNFVSDYSVSGRGFVGAYRAGYGPNQGCGGTLNATSGSFSSVDINNDGRYENGLDCYWRIIVGDNKLVRLTISSVQIELHPTCYFDYLKIYDGFSKTDPLLGVYCGTNAPGLVKSTSNFLLVHFYTDGSVTGLGFNATYDQEDALCGGALISSDEPQIITSPGYPSNLIHPLRCRWTIDAPTSEQRVRLTMTVMDLVSQANCTNEFVEFRDTPMGRLGQSVHYCGTSVPGLFDSARQTVQINYASADLAVTRQGFSVKYQTATCNRTYSGYSGQIYSPGWPRTYPRNVYCVILITGPPNTWVTLYFNSFSVESHRNCRFDYLQVRNGSTATSVEAATLCGSSIPEPIFATGNSLWLGFTTDGSIDQRGFDITYTASTAGMGCGGNITGINGSLTSPGYPGNYTERSTCRWIITVPARRILTVTFVNLNLIGSPNCQTDAVTVYNGNSEIRPMFGQYCGNERPAPLIASGNTVLVKFSSDGLGSAPGFRITFSS